MNGASEDRRCVPGGVVFLRDRCGTTADLNVGSELASERNVPAGPSSPVASQYEYAGQYDINNDVVTFSVYDIHNVGDYELATAQPLASAPDVYGQGNEQARGEQNSGALEVSCEFLGEKLGSAMATGGLVLVFWESGPIVFLAPSTMVRGFLFGVVGDLSGGKLGGFVGREVGRSLDRWVHMWAVGRLIENSGSR